jgi:hypothetical protein
MMEDADLLALLRSAGRDCSPSEVAELVGKHREGGLTHSCCANFVDRD